ncbi:CPBP family intramembrane metalloprotease [Burkholderia humptydooensis]|uniref:CPBP family intramembrane metalloprotease n=2 Tax=Burkholderia humptydooensis TaxID=430531 RepID=A0A7U4P307_9BURK|nr:MULTISPECIES: type II CAAX endopeptidase family protein [Burkholderia]AJY43434.1 CAAX protease self-immunity family protein [Burkholderia sp. 2002721687]ALX42054.1 CAAX protease [Burkholderia humptydooensis]EIP88731.1 CAAX amino terminal protease family protein [Burkholderia humptydooensis MSMB43]QPS42760.1 CPBP family intramembrane metalloprotease [Burkholderia humptydooensis]
MKPIHSNSSASSNDTSAAASAGYRGGRLRRVLLDQDGLRAPWGVLLFVAIFVGAIAGLALVSRRLLPMPAGDQALSVVNGAVMEAMQLASVALATIVLAWIERRSPFSYGLQGRARALRFAAGAVCGFMAISALVFALWEAGLLRFDAPAIHGARAWEYAAVWAAMFVMTGLFEESLLRGYLLCTLARWIGFWWGAVLLSALFGVLHVVSPDESIMGLVSAMLFGFVLCLSLWYTGSLWWAIGFHAAWDWGESYFYGAPDSGRLVEGVRLTAHAVGHPLLSGGTAGPEGSVLVLPLLAIGAFAMWGWWRRGARAPGIALRGESARGIDR